MVVVVSTTLLVPPFRRLFIYPLKAALLLVGLQLLFTSIRVEHTTHPHFTTRSLTTETVFCISGTPAYMLRAGAGLIPALTALLGPWIV